MTARRDTQQQRLHIIESVDALIYQKGFNAMSFSDIAQVSSVSKGNLYYYFKTKEEILQAVIEHRLNNMQLLLSQWEKEFPSALQRIKRYARIPLLEADNVIQFGCPMGSLNTELAKFQPQFQQLSRQQFDVFKAWLKKQFKNLPGKKINDTQAEALVMHLLVLTQGIAVMSQAYADKKIIKHELELLDQWLHELS